MVDCPASTRRGQSSPPSQPSRPGLSDLDRLELRSVSRFLPQFMKQFEAEADMVGMEVMARACYDVRQAPRLFDLMVAAEGEEGSGMAATHPSHRDRREKIRRKVADALEIREDLRIVLFIIWGGQGGGGESFLTYILVV